MVVSVRDRLARYVPDDRIFLNPDCGFGTFSSRPMNTPGTATQKLRAMTEAASWFVVTPSERESSDFGGARLDTRSRLLAASAVALSTSH